VRCADPDEVDVAAHDRAGPDRHILAQHHVTHHQRGRIDVAARTDRGQVLQVGADIHGSGLAVRERGL
jgi:hypothetical protein